MAFVVYFGSFLLMAWLFQFLSPLIAKLSDLEALRATMVLELLVYVPVLSITLFALKLLAEREQNCRYTWRDTLYAVGLRSDRVAGDTVTAVVGYMMMSPLVIVALVVSNMIFHKFHTPVHPVDLIILSTQDGFTRMLLLLQASVGAPIVEEITFRGLLFQGLTERWGTVMAAVLSAAVFALSHNTLPGGFLQLWTLGFIFALIFRRSRSILPCILMHAIHNGIVMMMMFAVFSQ